MKFYKKGNYYWESEEGYNICLCYINKKKVYGAYAPAPTKGKRKIMLQEGLPDFTQAAKICLRDYHFKQAIDEEIKKEKREKGITQFDYLKKIVKKI